MVKPLFDKRHRFAGSESSNLGKTNVPTTNPLEYSSPDENYIPKKDRGYIASATHNSNKLHSLVNDQDWLVRSAVAENPNTKKEDLAVLAKDKHWIVKQSVARNKNISKETLERLARSRNSDVRATIAKRNDISGDMLNRFLRDFNQKVRLAAIKNKLVNMVDLDKLAKNHNRKVRELVASNNKTSADTLSKLASCRGKSLLEVVASNPNTTAGTLERLSKSRHAIVRVAVVQNPNVSHSTILALNGDLEEQASGVSFGYCLYETVSEGTPTTPVFATEAELINWLTTMGQDYDQVPLRLESATALVKQGWSLGSAMVVNNEFLDATMDADKIEALGSK